MKNGWNGKRVVDYPRERKGFGRPLRGLPPRFWAYAQRGFGFGVGGWVGKGGRGARAGGEGVERGRGMVCYAMPSASLDDTGFVCPAPEREGSCSDWSA